MNKKGQAAMEFLLTYGWALLMIAIIVSSFAYLGFTDPDKFIANKCIMSSGFDCAQVGWVTNAGDVYAYAIVTNVLESDINIPDFDADTSIGASTFSGDCTPSNTIKIGKKNAPKVYEAFEHSQRMEREVAYMFLFECNSMIEEKKYKLEFSAPYRELRTKFTKQMSGELVVQGSANPIAITLTLI